MVDLRATLDSDSSFPQTVFVHMGTAEQAEEFFVKFWPEALAIGDPKQALYRAFSIGWGSLLQFVKPGVWSAYLKARSHGVGVPQGNTMRNPGAFLIHESEIVFAQDFEHFGVQVDVEIIGRQARELANS